MSEGNQVVGHAEPLRLVPLAPDEEAAIRRQIERGPTQFVLRAPDPGPTEAAETVAFLNNLVAELRQANNALVEREREQRRRAERAEACRDLLAEDLVRANDRTRMAREAFQVPLPLADWHEDLGPVLWWSFPVQEAPWCGSPGDSDWPGYHTHWTPLPGVRQPDGEPVQPTPLPPRLRPEGWAA